MNRLAELAGTWCAAASTDARAALEVAVMATAPTFAGVFDEIAERNELEDALAAAELVGGAHSTGPQIHHRGTETTEDTEARATDRESAMLADVREYMTAHGVGVERLAKAIGVRPGVVKVLIESPSIIPRDHRPGLIFAAARWCEADGREREMRRSAVVATAVTRAIAGVARAVRETRTVGLVVGGAGLGKSHALTTLGEEVAGPVVVVRVDVDARHARSFIRAVGRAASGGLDVRHAWSIGAGIETLRRGGGLLAVDEGQRLSPWALEAVRDLFDGGDVGVLLIGTRALGRHVSAEDDPAVGPLASRIALTLDLDREILGAGGDGRARQWIDAATVREIVGRHVAAEFDGDAMKALVGLANGDPYHLRAALNAARVAAVVARNRAGTDATPAVKADDIQTALRWRRAT